MKKDFATSLTGWAFIFAAGMLWGGWVLMPRHVGAFFEPEDFAAIYAHLYVWLWMFRVHLFGMVVTVLALVALGAVLAESPARILAWPGIAVATAGLIVGAVGAAFYYHFGVWGSLQMSGKAEGSIQSFVDSLRISTEYVTCLVRFGRVFSGLGLLVLALGLLKWNVFPSWIGLSAAAIGVASMAVTMFFPDHLSLYLPIFHCKALWLLATGIQTLRSGIVVTTSPGQLHVMADRSFE